jgi:peptide-methionine (S)-S-oxide reductase
VCSQRRSLVVESALALHTGCEVVHLPCPQIGVGCTTHEQPIIQLFGFRYRGNTMVSAEQVDAGLEVATFGGGCFWCLEAVFELVRGVKSVVSGYAGGHVVDPSYEQVCGKKTGHAEVLRVTFDPGIVTFRELLQLFFAYHDPTTPNRQGADIGPQYRSVIFYQNEIQKLATADVIAQITTAGLFQNPIVTEVAPCPVFYPAEDYHQGYYRNNPMQGYCQAVVAPKVVKFRKQHAHLMA